MRLLVCGDRDWTDKEAIYNEIVFLAPDVIIEGGARGADSMARDIAILYDITLVSFPADWPKYGKAAGPIRNQQMLELGKPDLVLAFHDDLDNSKGTKDMVNRARKSGVEVIVWTHMAGD